MKIVSDMAELKGSKRWCVDERDNEEENSFDEYSGEIVDARYILPSFITFLSFS